MISHPISVLSYYGLLPFLAMHHQRGLHKVAYADQEQRKIDPALHDPGSRSKQPNSPRPLTPNVRSPHGHYPTADVVEGGPETEVPARRYRSNTSKN
jgi:hypothetical protein